MVVDRKILTANIEIILFQSRVIQFDPYFLLIVLPLGFWVEMIRVRPQHKMGSLHLLFCHIQSGLFDLFLIIVGLIDGLEVFLRGPDLDLLP